MSRGHRLFLPLTAALVILCAGALRAEEWKPYLDDDGKAKDFPAEVSKVDDKEWLRVRYTDYTGMKPRMGVVMSEVKTGTSSSSEWARVIADVRGQTTNPFSHIEDLVRQALGATNRFTMLERTTAKDDVLEEQDFGASGRVDKKTSAEIGKMKGADYVVKATIIELNPEKDSKDIEAAAGIASSKMLGVGSVGISGKVAFCRLNVRIINAETGEIVSDMTVDGTAKSSGLSVGGGALGMGSKLLGGGKAKSESKKGAAISDAMQACANKVAYFVSDEIEQAPWQGAVANVSGSKVMINGGENVGIAVGQTLTILSKGMEIKDPETGESLGFDTSEIGTIKVVDVKERFATCEIVTGGDGVKTGDVVRLEK